MDFVTNLERYRKEMEQSYGEEASWKILLVKSMILTYRPLGHCGIRFSLPVAFVTGSPQAARQLQYAARGFCPVVYSSTNISDRDFKRLMEDYGSEVLLMQYVKSRNTEACLEKLAGICESGLSEGGRFCDPIFVAFAEGIPIGAKDCFAGKVRLDGTRFSVIAEAMTETEEIFTRQMIELVKEYWAVINDRISELSSSREFENLRRESAGMEVWTAVGRILEILITKAGASHSNMPGYLEKIREAGQQIMKEWDIEQITGDLCGIFRKMLLQSSADIEDIIDRRNIRPEDIQDGREQPFCDDEFYYIPEGLFGQIVSKAGEIFSINELKEVLAKQGILKTEGKKRRYYTCNMYFSVEGKIEKKRMICLYRDKVDIPYHTTWEESIKRKEKQAGHDRY